MSVTAKQVEALRYLLSKGDPDRAIDSTALWPLYAAAETEKSHHPQRVVAWKRISGGNMARMKRAGLLEVHGLTYTNANYRGSFRTYYRITEAGLEAARS